MGNKQRPQFWKPSVRYDPEMEPERVRWLVDGFWQLGKINSIAGFEKSGKTRLMNWLLVGMSKDDCLGLATGYAPRILYLCGEETTQHVNARIAQYAEIQGIPKAQFDIDFIDAAAGRLDIKSARDELLRRLLDDDRQMLVIDPLRNVHNADENDSSAMSPMFGDFRRWSNSYGITVLIVHHTPKIGEDTDMTRIASWFRGSTALPAILDTAQYVDRVNQKQIAVLRQGRFPPLMPLKIDDLGGAKLNDDRGFKRA